MKSLRWLLCLMVLLVIARAEVLPAEADRSTLALFDSFVSGYRQLHIPDFEMGYLENFKNMPSLNAINRQDEFFRGMSWRLRNIKRDALSEEVRYHYDALMYEIDFNCFRLRLERRFRSRPTPEPLPADGLHSLQDGKEWYLLYIRRWASKEISPEQLEALGNSEVTRVTGEIEEIERQLGYQGDDEAFYRHLDDPSFSITDERELKSSLQAVRGTVQMHLAKDFEEVNIPAVDIQPVISPSRDTPPGLYHRGVFYYTFYESRFPKRSMEWLFLHEAVPGHHYQMEVARLDAHRTELRKLFWYPGFSEGWAAYAEDLGKDMGCYGDRYQHIGKWEWDLVRSARVVIDVGIHYRGWTRDQALAWWKAHVPNQGAIAEREVDRVMRWPAQVISYKVGEREILDLRARAQELQGKAFDLKRFHAVVLKRGSIPLPVLREIVEDEIRKGAIEPSDGTSLRPCVYDIFSARWGASLSSRPFVHSHRGKVRFFGLRS